MDKAITDSCHVDYCRADVFDPKQDEILDSMKRRTACTKGGVDGFITGHWRTGHIRTGVYTPDQDEILDIMKKEG